MLIRACDAEKSESEEIIQTEPGVTKKMHLTTAIKFPLLHSDSIMNARPFSRT